METIEKTTPTFDSTERVLRINRWMAVALVLALAALVALGAWLLIDNFVTSDVEALDRRLQRGVDELTTSRPGRRR